MSNRTFGMMRVWAMLTGVVLVSWYFAGLLLRNPAPDMVSMLATAIAGFEMMLFGQELWFKRGANRG